MAQDEYSDDEYFDCLYIANMARSYYDALRKRGLGHKMARFLSFDLAKERITWEQLPERIKWYEELFEYAQIEDDYSDDEDILEKDHLDPDLDDIDDLYDLCNPGEKETSSDKQEEE